MHSLKTRHISVFEYLTHDRNLRRIAYKHGIGKSTLSRWVSWDRGVMTVDKRPCVTKKTSLVNKCTAHVATQLNQNAFVHIDSIQRSIFGTYGLKVSRSTINRCRKAAGYSYKLASRSQDQQRADLAHSFFLEDDIYDDGTISIDESAFISCDSMRRGWALRGRHVFKQPPKNRRRVSLLLAVAKEGVVASEIRHGSFKGDTFAAFVRTLPVGRRILLDNAFIYITYAYLPLRVHRKLSCGTACPASRPWTQEACP